MLIKSTDFNAPVFIELSFIKHQSLNTNDLILTDLHKPNSVNDFAFPQELVQKFQAALNIELKKELDRVNSALKEKVISFVCV